MEGRHRRTLGAAALAGLGALIVAGVAAARCTTDTDCKAPRRCVAGQCAWVKCTIDTQCPADAICEQGRCVPPVPRAAGRAPASAEAPPPSKGALPPPTDATRRGLLNALVPFKGKAMQFADGIARDPGDRQALLQLGQVIRAELGAADGPETVAVITAAGYDGGNNWQAVVAIWTGTGMLRSVGEFVVHDMQGSVEGVVARGGIIEVTAKRMGPEDPRCCPSVGHVSRLAVRDGVLVPAPGETGVVCDAQGRCSWR